MLRTSIIVLLLLVLSPGAEARAEASDVARAKRHFTAGKKSFERKDYQAALRQFTLAYEKWSNRVFHFNIAMCHAYLGQPVPAVRHLRQYLRGATPEERDLPDLLQQVQEKVGILVIQTPDAEASIAIGGQVVGHGQVEWVVEPGSHVVEIRREGQTVITRTLTVEAGKEARWTIQAVPRPAPRVFVAPRERRKLGTQYFATLATMSAVTFGAALGLYFKTDQVNRDYLTRHTPSLRDEGLRYQAATNALLAVSAGALVTTAVLAIFTRWKRKPERPLGVTVVPPSLGQGMVLGLTWAQ